LTGAPLLEPDPPATGAAAALAIVAVMRKIVGNCIVAGRWMGLGWMRNLFGWLDVVECDDCDEEIKQRKDFVGLIYPILSG
jgi:hypothetical protein